MYTLNEIDTITYASNTAHHAEMTLDKAMAEVAANRMNGEQLFLLNKQLNQIEEALTSINHLVE